MDNTGYSISVTGALNRIVYEATSSPRSKNKCGFIVRTASGTDSDATTVNIQFFGGK